MHIKTSVEFSPKKFVVHTFYGEKTCFCWEENNLVIFRYTNRDDISAEVLTTPARIKTIQCFGDRAFVICVPRGTYKISKDRKFAVLSSSAIGMGTVFYETLKPRDNYLYLDNKQTMAHKLLFELSSNECSADQLCVYLLTADTIARQFMTALTSNDSNVENLCIIAEAQNVFVLFKETVQIIYHTIHPIKDIIPVQKDSRIAGLLFLTRLDEIILIRSKHDKLVFEKIYLGTQIETICAGFSQLLTDSLWIVYVCESKMYYARKQLLVEDVQQIRVQDRKYVCFQSYDSKEILCLTQDKELVEISISTIERKLSEINDTSINLHPSMLDVTFMMDILYKESQKLHSLNEILTIEEDKLKRINLYAHKYTVRSCPKMTINRMANQLYWSINFEDALPKGNIVVFNVKLGYQNFFSMKRIEQQTAIDIHIPEHLTTHRLQVSTDLVILKEENCPWLVIKNCIINSEQSKKKKKSNFINSKIAMLENLIQEGNITMDKLSDIKRSVRKELNDI
ncbi:uncharacterized protein LOC108628819 [Ceratina calcarata]|uniref:Uncharacterized protein LOC108628819 n=1 Tax=Ceratina calcarata TaxID=156304 RepID=A0AAJ7J890_9HYME|nr:uncharacterized protein LOC108628819 [Ceratina calcarata]